MGGHNLIPNADLAKNIRLIISYLHYQSIDNGQVAPLQTAPNPFVANLALSLALSLPLLLLHPLSLWCPCPTPSSTHPLLSPLPIPSPSTLLYSPPFSATPKPPLTHYLHSIWFPSLHHPHSSILPHPHIQCRADVPLTEETEKGILVQYYYLKQRWKT